MADQIGSYGGGPGPMQIESPSVRCDLRLMEWGEGDSLQPVADGSPMDSEAGLLDVTAVAECSPARKQGSRCGSRRIIDCPERAEHAFHTSAENGRKTKRFRS
jgi:hypothetical protein